MWWRYREHSCIYKASLKFFILFFTTLEIGVLNQCKHVRQTLLSVQRTPERKCRRLARAQTREGCRAFPFSATTAPITLECTAHTHTRTQTPIHTHMHERGHITLCPWRPPVNVQSAEPGLWLSTQRREMCSRTNWNTYRPTRMFWKDTKVRIAGGRFVVLGVGTAKKRCDCRLTVQ